MGVVHGSPSGVDAEGIGTAAGDGRAAGLPRQVRERGVTSKVTHRDRQRLADRVPAGGVPQTAERAKRGGPRLRIATGRYRLDS